MVIIDVEDGMVNSGMNRGIDEKTGETTERRLCVQMKWDEVRG
jgi:hypothetical protein